MNPSADKFCPVRVVHIITGLGRGGAEIMLHRLLSRLDHSRFSSRIIVLTRKDALKSRIEALDVPVDVLDIGSGFGALSAIFRLVRLLRREQPDVVQTWLYHADLLGLAAAKLAGVKNVLWNLRCSTLTPGDVPRSTWRVIRLLAKLSTWPDAVVVNSQAGQDAHAAIGYHPRRWVLIPNGFDIERFRPDPEARRYVRTVLGIDAEALIVGLVARWHPMKDHANFFAAASRLRREVPGVRFVLVGEGIVPENGELFRLVKQFGLEDDVYLLGERDDIVDLTTTFDIAVSASYSEGFPTTVGEAMSCGIPCVVTNAGDSRLIVEDTGIVVPPHDPAALAVGMARLLHMPGQQRRELGIAARARICDRFSIDSVTERYAELYEGRSRE